MHIYAYNICMCMYFCKIKYIGGHFHDKILAKFMFFSNLSMCSDHMSSNKLWLCFGYKGFLPLCKTIFCSIYLTCGQSTCHQIRKNTNFAETLAWKLEMPIYIYILYLQYAYI